MYGILEIQEKDSQFILRRGKITKDSGKAYGEIVPELN
jgi:hypothetical protein